ncbi:hypothetical protein EYF80_023486 [Liparis tanakae]|uniref:Uncharacterized protein n=1 Tax=Liparis tanakae TaxID=230148 RepID=A0A4Z2HN86_9TELE|nr:hypothetical protein EYF80_023486 [Liparis tanakae]
MWRTDETCSAAYLLLLMLLRLLTGLRSAVGVCEPRSPSPPSPPPRIGVNPRNLSPCSVFDRPLVGFLSRATLLLARGVRLSDTALLTELSNTLLQEGKVELDEASVTLITRDELETVNRHLEKDAEKKHKNHKHAHVMQELIMNTYEEVVPQ